MTKQIKEKQLKLHHSALTKEHNGYVSTKIWETKKESYKGKYGEGFITYSHNPNSNRYCFKNYYIYV